MRLTVELILQSHQYINPGRDWTLSLRGYKIPTIENLGVTQDHFECIDLTDNELLKLENFPPLPRLKTLLDVLSDLLPLFQAKNLERLSLMDNGVRERAYYRLFVIFNLPKLRFLDYKRVTQQEREQARNTFKGEKGAKLAHEIAPPRKAHAALGVGSVGAEEKKATDTSADQIERIKLAIAKATTMEEITRLESALKAGYIPDELLNSEKTQSSDATEAEGQSARKK
ncbi:putative U2 small nuclear ribonucleoprotein [Neospora caninum Liverpool]|uniref:Putative U2 small nuclear ribonucleoprotein n=1 Tax=Neospora caninum (strain Liverpool) TaxID=572307 RepID=F0VJZ7_NEOCL|nr:putative U2 small nuclear ribonucleoprotein [Neospora caninum Liverpool]CBZ53227.1 putative U2 small nuclear ribonucleoprotein [Neospora caninum Liverpool]|eukprot:XP_003883259.1 putative U2 small nuclear ribonucleoprotein [Neospora caninum Liverpool]